MYTWLPADERPDWSLLKFVQCSLAWPLGSGLGNLTGRDINSCFQLETWIWWELVWWEAWPIGFNPLRLSLISQRGELVLDVPQHCLSSIAWCLSATNLGTNWTTGLRNPLHLSLISERGETVGGREWVAKSALFHNFTTFDDIIQSY